jgi:heme oxygenase
MSEIQGIMASVPSSHLGGDSYVSSEFKTMLTALHKTAPNDVKYKLPDSDPSKCPFKGLVTTQGIRLSEALDEITFTMAALEEAVIDAKPLSESLKKGTAVSHREAESVSFVKNFLRGRITVPVYSILIANLYHVYKAMEDAMDKHPEAMGALYLPRQLKRADRLLADWRYLTNESEQAFPPVTKAAQEYCERLSTISNTNPTLLISHAYTRYLGDLSGGQILQRCAKKAMDLPDGVGSSFYDFPEIPEGAKVFKNTYRDLLDAMNLSQSQVDDVVGEANVSFVLNMRIFEELDCIMKVPGAKVRPLEDALKFSTLWKGDKGEDKCPFGFTGPNPHKKKDEAAAAEKAKAKEQPAVAAGARCPWPFVVFHDPKTFIKDWQTWVVIGLGASYIYNKLR